MSSKRKNNGATSSTKADDAKNAPVDAVEDAQPKVEETVESTAEAIEDEAIIEDGTLDAPDGDATDIDDAEPPAEPDEDVLELTQGDSPQADGDAASGDPSADDAVSGDDMQDAAADIAPEPTPEPPAAPAPVSEAPKASGGFLPAFLGGLVAAGLGIGTFLYMGQDDGGSQEDALKAALDSQAAQIEALDAKLAEISTALANTGQDQIRDTITALSDQISSAVEQSTGALSTEFEKLPDQFQSLSTGISDLGGRISTLGETTGGLQGLIGALEERLSEVEKRPLVESSETAKAAFAAYERELERLKESLQSQQAQNENMADELAKAAEAARQDISSIEEQAAATRAQADEASAAAEARAQAAASREAAADLARALDAGAPFSGPLAVLAQSHDVPEALSVAAETGVATLPALQSSFPEAARKALDASLRTTMTDEPTNRIMSFLRSQTGARSLEPKEGDDPDAILSRAEAAVSAADIDTALQEVNTLPEAGVEAMADWIAQAQARQDATQAARDLSTAVMSE